jgi:hypothetical protein
MRNPMLILFLFMFTSVCSILCGTATAFAQAKSSTFSNTYDNDEAKADLFSKEEGKLETLWRARMYGESTALETQSAQIGGFDLFSETKYQMLETLEARVFLRAKFESGRSQSFFGDIEPNTGILFREAAIKYQPIEAFNIRAGVINQDWLDMPLLVFRQSFPGANAELTFALSDEAQVGFISQYAIPTSQTLAPRTVGAEATPSFITQTAYAKWDDRNFKISLSGNLYQYDNLPSYVAFESQKYGNSLYASAPGGPGIIGGPNNSRFNYEFKGWFTTADISLRMNSLFEPLAKLNVMRNEEAPEAFNDSQIYALGSRFHTNDHIFTVFYTNYFAESDVAPSYYNAWVMGNTNGKGQGVELYWQLKKKNFRVHAEYYRTDVINAGDDLQENQQYFYLGVETGYDKI